MLLGRLEIRDRKEIYRTLVGGFENASFQRWTDIPNYESLVERLKGLKPDVGS